MIKLENIEKEYRGKGISTKALNGVSLEIEDGALISVVGPSGSGKNHITQHYRVYGYGNRRKVFLQRY